jgi:spermidine synthase
MLGLVFGHTVYAITTVLAAFMGGMGLGSYVFGRRAAGLSDPIRTYGVIEIGIGLYCALTPSLFWLASRVYLHLPAILTASYEAFSFVQFVLVFAVLLVPTALMGATLPVLVQGLVRNERDISRTVGLLYAVNTFGAVVGVSLAGYVLLPVWGNRTVLWAAAVSNVAIGLTAIRCGSSRPLAPDDRPAAVVKLLSPGQLGERPHSQRVAQHGRLARTGVRRPPRGHAARHHGAQLSMDRLARPGRLPPCSGRRAKPGDSSSTRPR